MPTIFEIDATEWRVDHNLDDGVGAAGFSVAYTKRTAAGYFDPAYWTTLTPYRGEAAPDLVVIRATVDGVQHVVVTGPVDRHELRETSAGRPCRVVGRDRIAFLLERRPAASTTKQGVETNADGTVLTTHETFQGVVAQLAAEAGLTALFDCPEYPLGKSLAVTPDRTLAQYLDELLVPLRWSEKHRVDVWIEGDVLVVAQRGREARGRVQVEYGRLVEPQLLKTRPKQVAGIRVEGMTYQVEVPDIPHAIDEDGNLVPTGPVEGRAWSGSFSVSYGPLATSKTVDGVTTTYEETGTLYYDRFGKLTGSVRAIRYTAGKTREESMTLDIEYFAEADPNDPAPPTNAGKKKREVSVHRVRDTTAGRAIDQVVHEKDTSWTYFTDNGDERTMDAFEKEADESAGRSPLPRRFVTTRYRYHRSGRQTYRIAEVLVEDDTGKVEQSATFSEVGPFDVAPRDTGLGAGGQGTRLEDRVIASGPETAERVERHELLGSVAACAARAAELQDEHASERIGLAARLPADLRLRAGQVLEVLNPPAHWPVAEFVLTQVTHDGASADRDESLETAIEAVGWRLVA